MDFSINLDSGEVIAVRGDDRQVFEVVNGATVSIVPGTVTISQISGSATISNNTITPAAVGPSKYSVTSPDGSIRTLNLMTCESATLTTVGAAIKSGGFGGEPDTTVRRRRILRAISTDRPAWWDGTNASLLAGRNLTPYGC